MNCKIDSELMAIHFAAINLYNRETEFLKANPSSVASINATSFLAEQVTIFANSILFLLEDDRQPLNVPAALLRTCLEAQARANLIVAATGAEREQRASEFTQLRDAGHKYYETLAMQMTKDFAPNSSNSLPRNLPYLPHIIRMMADTDTSKLQELKKQYKRMSDKWNYGEVIGKDKLSDPVWLNRSEAQRLQPELYLRYVNLCAFVHSDPASTALALNMLPISVAYTSVMAQIIGVLCFFTALGKEKDTDLINLKKRFIAFDVNEKTLPKKDLPPT
jgi:hypothetical protein